MSASPVVLFLCTGNSARSQMAEGLLRSRAGAAFEVASAGTDPADTVHPAAVRVMQELGIDISTQRPKSVSEFLGRVSVRHLIIVCDGANAKCPSTFPGVLTRDFWPIDDPARYSGTMDETRRFREARDELQARIDAWLKDRAPSGTSRPPVD
jgi:arsenate reductase